MSHNSDKTTTDHAANDVRLDQTRRTPNTATVDIIAAAESGDYVLETLYLAEMFAERLYDQATARLDQSLSRKTIGASAFFGFKMFLPELLRQFDEEMVRWLRDAPDAAARKDLEAALDQITTRLRIMGTAHEHAKRLTWRAQAGEKLLAAKLEAVVASPHMALIIRDAGDEVIEAMVRLGTANEAAAERRRLFHLDVARTAIEALIGTDPAATLRMLESGGFDVLVAADDGADAASLRAQLLAYARDAADTHAADTAWLAEEAERDARMTEMRVAFETISDHRRAIAEDRASLLAIEADGQAGILDDQAVRQLSDELMAAQTHRRARLKRVHAVAKLLSAAMIVDEPVTAAARQDLAADQSWGQLIDEYYDDLFLPYLVQTARASEDHLSELSIDNTAPTSDAGIVTRQLDLTARLIRAAGHLPATFSRAVMRTFNGGPPEAQAALVGFVRDLLSHKGARAALARALPPDVLVRAIAMAPDAEGDEIGISAEEMVRRGYTRLRMVRDRTRRRTPTVDRSPASRAAGALDLRGRMRRPDPRRHPRGPMLAGRLSTELARRGRGGDTAVGHVAPGSVVLPVRLQNPALETVIREAFADQGLALGPAEVGGADDARHPATGAADYTAQHSSKSDD